MDTLQSDGLIVFRNLRQCTDIGDITEVKVKPVSFASTNAPGQLCEFKSLDDVRDAAKEHARRVKLSIR